jgi:hypothetical protein
MIIGARFAALLLLLISTIAIGPLDLFGREMRVFVVKKGSRSEVAGATTLSVWTADEKTRNAIVKRIRRCYPTVAIIRGDACARASITFHVQDQNTEGITFASRPRLSADADIQVRGYSCDTTTELGWYDQGKTRREVVDRFATAVCQLLQPPEGAK